jgi:hypothetical protein
LIGIANHVVSENPSVVEFAILVAHEDHLHGIGTTTEYGILSPTSWPKITSCSRCCRIWAGRVDDWRRGWSFAWKSR